MRWCWWGSTESTAKVPGKPAMDIQVIGKCLTDAKELVASVVTELKRSKSA